VSLGIGGRGNKVLADPRGRETVLHKVGREMGGIGREKMGRGF